MRTTSDPDLTALQERWSPGWHIWRACYNGIPSGSYVATRMDPAVGIWPTLMARDPRALEASLKAQAAAAAGESVDRAALEPPLMA